MTTPNHHDGLMNASTSGERVNHAARILSIARDRHLEQPVNREGYRRVTAARLAASAAQPST
ncbi:hypothetical protein BH23CHL9_BH23CHL9_07890 [soil metagenome]|jgi:hypothetical protein